MKPIIEVQQLSHSYGENVAINQLSFKVNQGEVFGLLGPNGAGKTTTIRLLNGMFEPSAGELQVLGYDPRRDGASIRKVAGVLTETPALYERLTARQNLKFFGTLAGLTPSKIMERTEELLHLFDLTQRANDRTGSYSKGMKQRLAIARAWMNHPKLLFLDEPTSGLDPEAAVQVRELIVDVRQKEGTTVLICTHNLDEAQRLCDRLLILRKGAALAQGSLADLRRIISPGLWLEISLFEPFTKINDEWLQGMAGVLKIDVLSNQTLRLEVESQAVIPEAVSRLAAAGARILRVQPQEISLEEVYLRLQSNHLVQAEKEGAAYAQLS